MAVGTRRGARASVCVALALTSMVTRARADDPPAAVAESLFDEGRKLLEEGKVEEACSKLEASNRADSAVGTLLNLGECNERRGRLASAWSNYRAAASLALTRGDRVRAEFARKRGESVQPRISTLTIVVKVETGLRVKRDGLAVEDAAWGAALPVDPGPHVIEASAPGKKSWTGKVVVPEEPGVSSFVRVEPLAPDTSAPTAPPPLATPPAPSGGSPTLRTLGFVSVGLAAAAMGSGAYFALHARSVWADASDRCDSANRCDELGVSLNAEARRSGDYGTVFVSLGLVLAAAGTLAIVLAPPTKTGASLTAHGARLAF